VKTSPLIEIHHDYPDKSVFLDVHVVWEYSGEARGVEGQPMAWVSAAELSDYDFPEANKPIVAAIVLELT
jgi:8-oxo-dGTP diphosphatase